MGARGTVIGIDANPYCVTRITESRDWDNYPQVEVLHAAVSDSSGETKFNLAPDPMYSSVADLNQTDFTKVDNEITVPVVNLDQVTSDRQLTDPGSIRLAKIDVEGAEVDLLKGSSAALQNQVFEYLYIELHDQQLRAKGQDRQQVENILKQHGYEVCHRSSPARVVYQSSRSRNA